jgi:hypothetical protein
MLVKRQCGVKRQRTETETETEERDRPDFSKGNFVLSFLNSDSIFRSENTHRERERETMWGSYREVFLHFAWCISL